MTARRLPKGWKSGSNGESRWYATAPYDVEAIKRRSGFDLDASLADQVSHPAWNLDRTVSAGSWGELCAEAQSQVALYGQLSGGGKE